MLKIQTKYFAAVLRQEIGWHDTQNSASLSGKLLNDIPKLRAAFDFRLSIVIIQIGSFLWGLVIAFSNGWKLALIAFSLFPFVFLAYWAVTQVGKKRSAVGTQSFQDGEHVAAEDIALIRTIWIFCTQQLEYNR